MSDGNFNRALLPHTPYASGMKAGKQIAKMHAVELLRDLLREYLPDLSSEQSHQICQDFDIRLGNKIKT